MIGIRELFVPSLASLKLHAIVKMNFYIKIIRNIPQKISAIIFTD